MGNRRGLLRGDLGRSIWHKRPVSNVILERIPATLQLSSLFVDYGSGVGFTIWEHIRLYIRVVLWINLPDSYLSSV